jgi:hypothetical protein
MKRILALMMGIMAVVLAVLSGRAISAQDKQDKYTLQVPGGLEFSEIKGYEQWQVVGPASPKPQP